MTCHLALAFALAVAGFWTPSIEAQGPPRGLGGFRRTINKAILLGSDEVRRELALNEAQKTKLEKLAAENREKTRDFSRRRSRESADLDVASSGEKRSALERELDRSLQEILEERQYQRLNEILLQQKGPEALLDGDVVSILDLSDTQVDEIKKAIAWGREERSKLFGGFRAPGGGARRDQPPPDRGGGPPDRRERRRKRDQLRKDVEFQSLAVLGDAQKTEFTKLRGEPLELDRRSLFGGPGRRGGRFGFGAEVSAKRLNPEELDFEDGTARVPDRATFDKLSYQGPEVLIDTHLDGIQFLKFQIERAGTDGAQLYFINTKTHRGHMMFMRAAGLERDRGQMRGVLAYRPLLKASSGSPGVYTYEFEPNDSYAFDLVKIAYDLLLAKMPILAGRLGYRPLWGAMDLYDKEKGLYEAAKLRVYLDDDLYGDIGYLPLNTAESFGRLRLMRLDERPGPRDVVLYKTLPNEMPRVAGIITGVRQTPLSHVNLRAVQDKVPNAFITGAAEDLTIQALIGKNVYYRVGPQGYEIREAKPEEVESHFAHMRPKESQVPECDLSVTEIRPIDAIQFSDSRSFGVKNANLAAMRSFGLPEGTIPDGFGVPFYFYDAFMKHNGFYDMARNMLEEPILLKDRAQAELKLAEFRKLIERGNTPDWMSEALAGLHRSFPAGSSIRCRSSTNNEDLPGFSGAGLYDSFTHHPSEGHLSKTIKQVFASLWNFRAFDEREFYRVDHFATSMGILVHANFDGELANGVAVTNDVLYQTDGNYYLNAQIGEDLVTNPEELSVPEETLVDWWESDVYRVVRSSNRVAEGKRVLGDEQLGKLRSYLTRLHAKFCLLYGKTLEDEKFAMEFEFKITREGAISIKQARPWVY